MILVFCFALNFEASEIEITILHTNDLHQHLEPLPHIAGYVTGYKKIHPNTLFVDAGDWFDRGSSLVPLTQGEALYGAMREMGYDAWIVGNHDWAYGGERLVELMGKYPTPVLATNLATTMPPLPTNVVQVMVRDFEGVRVGLFGITLDTYGTDPKGRPDLYVLDCRERAVWAVAELKEAGADIIVAVTHLGFEKMKHEVGRSFHPSDQDLVKENPDIDVVIGGHSHQLLKEETIREVHEKTGAIITQAGAQGRYVGRLTLLVDADDRSIRSFEVEAIEVSESLPKHRETAEFIAAQYAEHMPNASAVVGEFKLPMPLHGLAFWYADFIRQQAGADVCLLPRKALYDEHASFEAGEVDVERLMGYLYDRYVVTGMVKGADLLSYCDTDEMRDRFNPLHHQGRPFSGDAVYSDGIDVSFDADTKKVKFEIDPDKIYKVAFPWPYGRNKGALPTRGQAEEARLPGGGDMNDLEPLPMTTHELLVREGMKRGLDFYRQPPRALSDWDEWTKHFEAKLK